MKKLLFLAPCLFLMACGEDAEEKKDYIETEYDIQISEYLEDKDWEPIREDNGMYIYTEVEGEGQKPGLQDYLSLSYEGRLLDGTVFDGTEGNVITFPFPLEGLIKGWQLGIPHFGKGGKGTLIIPPDLGYGDRAGGPIPANSVLVFDIEIVDYSPTPPAPEIDMSVDYSSEIDAYIASEKLTGFEKSETGLYIKVNEAGSDEKPTVNSFLTLNYEGYLLDGSSFDGTKGTPTTFPFTLGNTILGWQEGIPLLGKGGKGSLIIPPYLGYGDRDSPDIPAHSILVFDIEIIDFTDTPAGQNL
jgi:FKBP-type peptidyl-prolyl cis-trans isomerase